ncbi:MAG: DUF3833 domain-containing protein [Rhodospirillales bacterium]
MKRLSLLLAIAATLVINGCSSMKPQDFAGKEPRLILEDYFAGKTQAWGIFEDRFGNLRREFTVDITGEWDGKMLTLTEDFLYSDGETEQRIWRIRKIDEHRYEGRAGDIIGTADGSVYGNALNWSYDMMLPIGDSSWKVSFDDWMFLQPGGVLLNRAKVSKWGILLGEVTLSFSKPTDAAAKSAAKRQPKEVFHTADRRHPNGQYAPSEDRQPQRSVH